MPDDDALIGQGLVDERNEARRNAYRGAGTRFEPRRTSYPPEHAPSYADEHEGGQLRIAVAGEQVPLLPLPDKVIPQRCHLCHHGADEGHALSCPTRWY